MDLVLMGLLFGFCGGVAVGWIGGRMAGIGEGKYRARRDMTRHQLQRDSMAEFAAPRVVRPAPARRALDTRRGAP